MTIYLLSRKGVLHKGEQSEGGVMTLEADNIDATLGRVARFADLHTALNAARRPCRRCFPGGAE